jgi:hypothetical protein
MKLIFDIVDLIMLILIPLILILFDIVGLKSLFGYCFYSLDTLGPLGPETCKIREPIIKLNRSNSIVIVFFDIPAVPTQQPSVYHFHIFGIIAAGLAYPTVELRFFSFSSGQE